MQAILARLLTFLYTAGETSNSAENVKSEQMYCIQSDSLILGDKNDMNMFQDI